MDNIRGSQKKIRVFLAKGGTDAHTVGIINLAKSFRDAGMEVIFGGLYLDPEGIVSAAVEEDVDVIGISQLDGNHMGVFSKVRKLMDEKGAKDILLIGGGVIPPPDAEELKRRGVGEIFFPGTPKGEIIDYIKAKVKKADR
jgi:methylmalonyl-CoA mutase C-terminal domain/subunit